LRLQGSKQVITVMYDSVNSFKCKLSLWAKQLQSGNLSHFSALQSLAQVEPERVKYYSAFVSQLLDEFDRRFYEFQAMEPQFSLFSTPFPVDVESVSVELPMELVELQCDTILKQKCTEIGIPDFYTYLSRIRFPKLLAAAASIMAMFGTTYVCEQFFSSMKLNESALRSRLTDEHLRATLRLATARDIKPNLNVLVSAKRCQLSSQSSSN